MTNRITHHKILGSVEFEFVPFTWNSQILYGNKGESLTAALLANDVRTLRKHERDSKPRGMYCNIGHCSECRVTVDGKVNQRACLTPLKKDMKVEQQIEIPYVVEEGEQHV